jgi:choline dehydrogenase-like flavoprotein
VSARTLSRRWLHLQGQADPEPALARALARVQRYDAPLPRLWPWLVGLLDLLAPLLVLGRWRRASRLADADLARLEDRLHHHRLPFVRALAHLWRLPLWDAVHDNTSAEPVVPRVHPLQPRLARQAARPVAVEVAIIGSGAGGAPLAWRLAQAGVQVAVLEAGGLVRAERPLRALEQAYLRQGMAVALTGGLLPVFAGQGAGGTTAINSGTCLRPPAAFLERWDALTGTDFAHTLGPFLDVVEAQLGVTVPPRDLLGASAHRFEAGLAALGRTGAYVLPRNAPDCQGDGVCCFGCPTGAKRSTDRAFLPQALDSGATLHLGTRVLGIDGGPGDLRLHLQTPDGPTELRARHVVLAAGALQTPALIRGSRLGPHWRQAGDHLKIHPATKVFARFDDEVAGERGVPQGLGYLPPELERVVCEGIFTPVDAIAPILAVTGAHARRWLDGMRHVATFGLMVRDRGHGRVTWHKGWPVLDYRLGAEDALDLGRGLLLIAEAFFAAGARTVLLPVVGRDPEVTSRQALRDQWRPEDFRASRLIASGFHPQGTAGIGRVVDRELRLSPGVSVCDASVLPDTPGVNPQLTIMALSLRLAERLLAERPWRQSL